jgi:hypothetical protein
MEMGLPYVASSLNIFKNLLRFYFEEKNTLFLTEYKSAMLRYSSF